MTATAKAALGAEIAAAAAAAAPIEGEQLALLPAPTRFQPGSASHKKMADRVKRHDAGRPPGARNLATRQTLDFVRKTVGDPLLERARWLRHTPESLAAELGCTKLEAFDRLMQIYGEISKLYYAALAPVDDKGNVVVPRFNLTIGGAAQGDDSRAPWLYMEAQAAPQAIENAGNSEPPELASHGAASHESAK